MTFENEQLRDNSSSALITKIATQSGRAERPFERPEALVSSELKNGINEEDLVFICSSLILWHQKIKETA